MLIVLRSIKTTQQFRLFYLVFFLFFFAKVDRKFAHVNGYVVDAETFFSFSFLNLRITVVIFTIPNILTTFKKCIIKKYIISYGLRYDLYPSKGRGGL